jgi:PLP dependent protein
VPPAGNLLPVPPSSPLSARLAEVRQRIAAACDRTGRDPSEVRLIAVTKTFPPEVAREALAAGLADLGENRVQELEEKAQALAGEPVRWHLIGPLQRNKARRAVEYAEAFHALDSERLAEALERHAEAAGRVLPCYVQVNVSGEGTKSGVSPEEAPALLAALAGYPHLRLEGLMTLAAPADSEAELEGVVRPQFRQLREIAEGFGPVGGRALRLSMGMSGDYEIAVEEGATDLRLGTALFGAR